MKNARKAVLVSSGIKHEKLRMDAHTLTLYPEGGPRRNEGTVMEGMMASREHQKPYDAYLEG
jgi:hypothetical protein